MTSASHPAISLTAVATRTGPNAVVLRAIRE